MEQIYGITSPELFTILDGDRAWRGADQEWYADEGQRKAGCGPTTASHLVSYLADTRPGWGDLYPSHSRRKRDFLALMNEMWEHVTPGRMGVNTLHAFVRGLESYAREKGLELPIRELDVPALKSARPTVGQCAAFLRTALAADSPVAFLNLSHGLVKELDSWHWVTIVGLEQHGDGLMQTTILDGGREYAVDFRLWFQSTRAGGGLIYVPGV